MEDNIEFSSRKIGYECVNGIEDVHYRVYWLVSLMTNLLNLWRKVLLEKLIVHQHVHKSPLLVPILCQMLIVHTFIMAIMSSIKRGISGYYQ
jgi:hypothetical protein